MDPDEAVFTAIVILLISYPISLMAGMFMGDWWSNPTFSGCTAATCGFGGGFSFIPTSNPFYILIVRGDFLGFIGAWFSSAQTAFSAIAVIVGAALLIIIGLGISVEASALTFGFKLGSNTQGSRFAQAFGIGLVLWGSLSALFTSWYGNMGILGTGLYVIVATIYFYGIWGWARSWR